MRFRRRTHRVTRRDCLVAGWTGVRILSFESRTKVIDYHLRPRLKSCVPTVQSLARMVFAAGTPKQLGNPTGCGAACGSRRGAGSKIMNEDDDEFDIAQESGEFLADIAARLIENEIYKNNLPKVALILAGVLDFCMAKPEEGETLDDFKAALLMDIVHGLMYHEAVMIPTEEQIEQEAKSFKQWLEDATEEFKNEHEEDTNP